MVPIHSPNTYPVTRLMRREYGDVISHTIHPAGINPAKENFRTNVRKGGKKSPALISFLPPHIGKIPTQQPGDGHDPETRRSNHILTL